VVVIYFVIGIFLNSLIIGQILGQTIESERLLFLKIFAAIIIPLVNAALPEEIFYRVILQTRIEKKYGWLASILISAILFALFHFPSRILLASGVEGTAGNVLSIFLHTLAPVFIAGLIFGFLWNRNRNIYLLISLHYGIDLLPSIASFIGIKI
jgi:membrane protease YdiL (CAAX protease family)